eukprot:3812424-Prymnesium_polylepis.2
MSGQDDSTPVIGIYRTVQSVVVFALFLRLIGYFRGFLALGALVHMVAQVFHDIIPFMMLLLISTVAFSLSFNILLQFSDTEGYGTMDNSLYKSLNMGVYSDMGKHGERTMQAHIQVVVLYEFFMLSVQLVLLNLLIAIMSDTHSRVSEVAKLVAHYERAKLVLEEEEKLMRSHQLDGTHHKRRLPSVHRGRGMRRAMAGSVWLERLVGRWFFSKLDLNNVAPRWLHVLVPLDLERKKKKDGTTSVSHSELSNAMDVLSNQVREGQQRLTDMVGEVERERRDRENNLHKQTLQAFNAEIERLCT